jgi:hypothetical protein
VADEELVYEVNGPDDPVDEKQYQAVVIMPTDHQGVDAQDKIDDAGISAAHMPKINKKAAIFIKN